MLRFRAYKKSRKLSALTLFKEVALLYDCSFISYGRSPFFINLFANLNRDRLWNCSLHSTEPVDQVFELLVGVEDG